MNNCFYVWLRIKCTIFCFILVYCFLNFITKFITNLNPLKSFKKISSLLLIAYWVFLSCSSALKKAQDFNIISVCIILKAWVRFDTFAFSIVFVSSQKDSGYVVSLYQALSELLLIPIEEIGVFKNLSVPIKYFKFGTQPYERTRNWFMCNLLDEELDSFLWAITNLG